jgi:hypothetical protein
VAHAAFSGLCCFAQDPIAEPTPSRAGQVTFEIESDGTARGRVAESGFKNPLWIPGWIDWDGEDPDEFAFHFEGCGNIQFLRVSPNFELSEQTLRSFVAQNYTRVAYAHGTPCLPLYATHVLYLNDVSVIGMWWILPKQHRAASDAAIDSLVEIPVDLDAKLQAQRCTICLLDFEEGDIVSQLPCRHLYHPVCAKKWLTSTPSLPTHTTDEVHSLQFTVSEHNSCPLCKKPVPEKMDVVVESTPEDMDIDISLHSPSVPHQVTSS